MGKLLLTRVYLCGAIDKCPDSGKGWRDKITPILNDLGSIVINPLEKPVDMGLEDDDSRAKRKTYKDAGQYDEVAKIMKVVRPVDLRLVDASDYIVAYIDTDVQFCGTIEEITLANRQRKPVLLVCKQGKKALNDWFFGMLPNVHIFDNFEDMIEYLKLIDVGEYMDQTRRWVFINLLDQTIKVLKEKGKI